MFPFNDEDTSKSTVTFVPPYRYVIPSRWKRKFKRVYPITKGKTIVRFHNADNKKNCTHEMHIFVISRERETERSGENSALWLIVCLHPRTELKRHGIQLIFQCFFIAF